MPFEKGHSLSTGRPKGSKDRIGSDVKSLVKTFVHNYFNSEQSKSDWEKLDPYQRLTIIQRLSAPLIPREINIGSFQTTTAAELLAMSPQELAEFRKEYNAKRKEALAKGAELVILDAENNEEENE